LRPALLKRGAVTPGHQSGAITAPQHKSLRASACAPEEGRGYAPWHFLYFLPDPHQHGSLRPILSFSSLTTVSCSGIGTPPPLPGWALPSTAAAAARSAPDAGATAAWPRADGCSAVPPE